MHLPTRDTVSLCIHMLHSEHDALVKANVKTWDASGKETDGPIIRIKRAMDDLIRYDAHIVFMKTLIQDLDEE